MRKSKPISVTLTSELAEAVKERVASGQYASESEVVRAGLRALIAREEAERDVAVESWLETELPKRIAAHKADPSRAVPLEEAFAELDRRIEKRFGKEA